NLVESRRDLATAHAHDRALQVDVLAAGHILVKASGDLDERAGAADDRTRPARWLENPVQQLEDRRFAGAVVADDPERFARSDFEAHVLDGPKGSVGRIVAPRHVSPDQGRDQIAQGVVALAASELLEHVIEYDARAHQMCS